MVFRDEVVAVEKGEKIKIVTTTVTQKAGNFQSKRRPKKGKGRLSASDSKRFFAELGDRSFAERFLSESHNSVGIDKSAKKSH